MTKADRPIQPDPAPEEEDLSKYPPGHPVAVAAGRLLSDTYSFWCICDAKACRRSGCCVGDPMKCLRACAPMLSETLFICGHLHIQAKCEGLTFDEAFERWPALVSLYDWNDRLENRVGVIRPRQRRPKPLTALASPPPPRSAPRGRDRPAATSRNAAPVRE